MGQSIKLYTVGEYMKNAVIDDTSNGASNTWAILDNLPDTYWTSGTTADEYIDIDLGAAYEPDKMVVYLSDQDGIRSTPALWRPYYWDGATFTTGGTANAMYSTGYTNRQKYRITSTSGGGTPRQIWRFAPTSTPSTAMLIGGVWLCKEWDLGRGSELPESDKYVFYNRQSRSTGSGIISFGSRNNYVQIRRRQFVFHDATSFGYLRDAFLDSYGTRYPLFLVEDSAVIPIMVRFTSDIFETAKESFELYKPVVEFEEVAFALGGELY